MGVYTIQKLLSFATLSLLLTVTDAEFDGHTYSVPISSTSSAFTRWRELQSSSVVNNTAAFSEDLLTGPKQQNQLAASSRAALRTDLTKAFGALK